MTRYLYYVVFSVLFAVIFYYISANWIMALTIFALYLIFFFSVYQIKFTKFKTRMKRSYECISFINNFVISLSVTNSVYSTYEKMKENVSSDLKLQMDSIEHLDVEKKIEYLQKYFELPIYGVFINIIKQYIETGTSILEISQLLIHDTRNLENRIHNFEAIAHKKENDFLISWGFTFLILVILQLSLTSFVINEAIKLNAYSFLLFAYFLMFIGIYYLFILRIYDTSFVAKGESELERTQPKNTKVKSKSKKRIFNAKRN